MKNKLAVFLCFIMICQVVMAGDFAGGESMDSYAVTQSQSEAGEDVQAPDEAIAFDGLEESYGPDEAGANEGFDETIGSMEADDNLFGALERDDHSALEDWDEGDNFVEPKPVTSVPPLFSTGEDVLEEEEGSQAEIAEEDQPQAREGEWSFYTYYIDPLYQDVLTENELDSLPEGVTQDSMVAGYNETFQDIQSAGEYMRKKLVEHANVVSFRQELSPELEEEFENDKNGTKKREYIEKIYKEAIRHTKNPVEGDYIWRTCTGYKLYSSEIINNFSASYLYLTYVYTYKTTLQQEAEINAVVSDLKNKWDFSGASEIEIIRTVYDCVCSGITYDVVNLNTRIHFDLAGSGYGLVSKKVVCDGFATILYRLFLEVGIDSRVILGDDKGGTGHAWNICKVGNLYYYLDSTWDSGLAVNGEPYEYFLRGKDFDDYHIPNAECHGPDFWAIYPLSETDYYAQETPSPTPALKSGTCGENLTWTLNETGMLVINGKGAMYDYTYEMKNEKPVTTAPWGTGIKRVYLRGGSNIGSYAFAGCNQLNNIYIGNTTNSIGFGAFYHCDMLIEVNFGANSTLTEIKEYAFYVCPILSIVKLPKSVKTISAYAFCSCDCLTKIELPEGLETIGNHAFMNCKYLWSIDLPQSVTSIGSYAFQGCIAFSDIHLPEGLTKIEEGTFAGCSGLGQVTVPRNILSIGNDAFKDCQDLVSMIIEGGDTTLGERVVSNCPSLMLYGESGSHAEEYAKTHGIPFGLVSEAPRLVDSGTCGKNMIWSLTGDGTLYINGVGYMEIYYDYESTASDYKQRIKSRPWGTDVKRIIIGHGITRIGGYAFYQCTNLESVTVSDTVKLIQFSAFEECSQLKSITLPRSVTEIESNVFKNCSSLQEITLSEGLSIIRGTAFKNCSSLQEVTLPEGLSYIGKIAFENCSSLTTVNIPKGITSINDGTFVGCTNLARVTIPDGVEYIGNYAFKNCSSLQEVTLPEGLSYIGEIAFENCSSLTTVNIPKGITSINDGTFVGCTNLARVTIPDGVEYIGNYAFKACGGLTTINIPDSVDYIGDHAFKECDELTTINIPNGVKYIGDAAFYSCDKLASINIPEEVTRIEKWTFGYCSSLTNMILPKGIEYIGDVAFYGCSSLENINLPDKISYIEEKVFSGCKSLTNIVLPNGLKKIKKEIFLSCVNLQSVVVRGNPSIEDVENVNPFYNCPKLTIYGESGTYIETYAKENNIPFKLLSEYPGVLPTPIPTPIPFDTTPDMTLPAALQTIEEEAFLNCKGASVKLQNGVNSIEKRAFADSDQLSQIEIPSSVIFIASDAFDGSDGITIYCVINSYAYYYAKEHGVKYVIE